MLKSVKEKISVAKVGRKIKTRNPKIHGDRNSNPQRVSIFAIGLLVRWVSFSGSENIPILFPILRDKKQRPAE